MRLTHATLRLADLLTVTLCALLGAHALTSLIVARLEVGPAGVIRRAAAPAVPDPSKQVDGILERNIFCSSCLPGPGREAAAPPERSAPRPSSLPVKLLAIMASPRLDPRWSLAVIRDEEAGAAGPFVVGAELRGWTILAIRPTRVYLTRAAALEYVDLLEAPPPAAPAARPSPARDPLTAAVEKGLKRTGEHSFEIRRSAVDALLGNIATLSGTVRVQPELRGDRPIGFRVFLRPDTALGRLGLQDRDVLTAIDGLEMSSPEQLLPIYTKLRTASHLSIALERQGRKVTIDYDIR